MKGGGWFSRLTGRSGGTDPFAAMGTPPRGTATVQPSPVGVPVAPAPGPDGSTGQFAQPAPPPAAPAEPRPERAPAPGRDAVRVSEAWSGVCDHFSLQVMLLAEQLRPALDQLEDDEQDPDRLERLYTVDHAITRIRRAARDLRVLSGRADDETTGPTSSLVDTIRVAMSSIERYTQVSIGSVAELAVVGYVADDVASLIAALLDNATRYSPSTVTVSGHLVSDGGVMFRIEDSGIGLTAPHVAALNRVLDSDVPAIDDHTARHTGFAVVHRLARKHGIRVQLASRAAPAGGSGGTTAMVTIPASLLTEIPDPPLSMAPVTANPDEPDVDPQATAHLTVARPARRGPVAAVPDDAVDDAPAEAPIEAYAEPPVAEEPTGTPYEDALEASLAQAQPGEAPGPQGDAPGVAPGPQGVGPGGSPEAPQGVAPDPERVAPEGPREVAPEGSSDASEGGSSAFEVPPAAAFDDTPAGEWPAAAFDQPVPYEPGTDDVTPNGFAEPAVVRDETPPPLPRREPASLRGPDALPPPAAPPPEPPAEEAAEQRRAFADDVAAFSAAFGAPPVDDPPADDVPVDETPASPPPLEEAHVVDPPVDDRPADQPPLEEAHVDDVPSADAYAGPNSEEQVP